MNVYVAHLVRLKRSVRKPAAGQDFEDGQHDARRRFILVQGGRGIQIGQIDNDGDQVRQDKCAHKDVYLNWIFQRGCGNGPTCQPCKKQKKASEDDGSLCLQNRSRKLEWDMHLPLANSMSSKIKDKRANMSRNCANPLSPGTPLPLLENVP
jgi:hypothetical protein